MEWTIQEFLRILPIHVPQKNLHNLFTLPVDPSFPWHSSCEEHAICHRALVWCTLQGMSLVCIIASTLVFCQTRTKEDAKERMLALCVWVRSDRRGFWKAKEGLPRWQFRIFLINTTCRGCFIQSWALIWLSMWVP